MSHTTFLYDSRPTHSKAHSPPTIPHANASPSALIVGPRGSRSTGRSVERPRRPRPQPTTRGRQRRGAQAHQTAKGSSHKRRVQTDLMIALSTKQLDFRVKPQRPSNAHLISVAGATSCNARRAGRAHLDRSVTRSFVRLVKRSNRSRPAAGIRKHRETKIHSRSVQTDYMLVLSARQLHVRLEPQYPPNAHFTGVIWATPALDNVFPTNTSN